MPRIAKRWLEAIVYIYADKASAEQDKPGGGTGFIVGRRLPGGYQTFVVTNRHVIEKMANPVIRLNGCTGQPALFPTNRLRWEDHPDGDDVSMYQLDINVDEHRHSFFWEGAFLTPDNPYIGLGSDVAMLGRFIGLSGQIDVRPTARFGSVASPMIMHEVNSYHNRQETLVIECHSLQGFSGSPVIAYLPSTAVSEQALENPGIGPFLLGVVWKHFGSPEEVLDQAGAEIGAYVKGNSGLAGVVPAWRLPALLGRFPETVSGTFTRPMLEPPSQVELPGLEAAPPSVVPAEV